MKDYASSLARYNRLANERIYDACAHLDTEAYRATRPGSFGSIHKLLNHMLLGDRIWMSRFAGRGGTTPALDTILFEEFTSLRAARAEEDGSIESFFVSVDESFFAGSISYRNSRGADYVEPMPLPVLHFFNHQTHHRGQIHVMLADAGLQPPALDLHRILNP